MNVPIASIVPGCAGSGLLAATHPIRTLARFFYAVKTVMRDDNGS